MKLNNELKACTSTGIKEEIVGVGYLFTGANGLSVITCYNTKVGLFSFNNTTTKVDIRPYDIQAFPSIIGKGGEGLVGLKHRSGATDIRMIEVSLVPNFSNIQTTSYKTSVKDGNYIHKKQIKVCHFDSSGFSSDQFLEQSRTFILVAGEAASSSTSETHELIGHTMAVFKEQRLELQMLEEQREEKMLQNHLHQKNLMRPAEKGARLILQRERLLSGRVRSRWYSSANNYSEGYQSMCDNLLDQKYIHHNKGKKYSKNLKVCIQNNNNSSRSGGRSSRGKRDYNNNNGNNDSNHKADSKRNMAKLSKERAALLARHDVARLRKKSRNWRCAPVTREIVELDVGGWWGC